MKNRQICVFPCLIKRFVRVKNFLWHLFDQAGGGGGAKSCRGRQKKVPNFLFSFLIFRDTQTF